MIGGVNSRALRNVRVGYKASTVKRLCLRTVGSCSSTICSRRYNLQRADDKLFSQLFRCVRARTTAHATATILLHIPPLLFVTLRYITLYNPNLKAQLIAEALHWLADAGSGSGEASPPCPLWGKRVDDFVPLLDRTTVNATMEVRGVSTRSSSFGSRTVLG